LFVECSVVVAVVVAVVVVVVVDCFAVTIFQVHRAELENWHLCEKILFIYEKKLLYLKQRCPIGLTRWPHLWLMGCLNSHISTFDA